MAGAQGSLRILDSSHYRVFAGPGFVGNPTVLHQIEQATSKKILLEHSRTHRTSDNAYIWPGVQPGHYQVRVFSHHDELKICGHALFAVADHLLKSSGRDVLHLETLSFTHECRRQDGRTWLALPAWSWSNPEMPLLRRLLADAGVRVNDLLHFRWNVWVVITDVPETLKEFSRESFPWHELDVMKPGALILSAASDEWTYCFRYFSPWFGKPEDSATGSAHCYLARYWLRDAEQGRAQQLSPAGLAEVQVRLEHDRVWLTGSAHVDRMIL